MKLAIIGGGSWGTALGCVMAPRFETAALWVLEPDLALRMEATRINDVYLPTTLLPAGLTVGSSLEGALAGADVIVSVMPSHFARAVYVKMLPLIPAGAALVSATKGLEAESLLRMSQVIRSVTGEDARIAVLSGPTFAAEVAAGNPTAVVLASDDADLAADLQQRFSGPAFRVYASNDPVGVEIGGAMKNVIAIGAGISDGMNLGHNAIAALITRGLAELTRLAVALGARPETLAGLAGLGDLVLTCTGDLSRNRQVGLRLATGSRLNDILTSTPMVAEGVKTTSVALKLAASCGVSLPITQEMHYVLSGDRTPAEAIRNLMGRSLRAEAG